MDIVEIVLERTENDDTTYRIMVNGKDVGFIQVLENTIENIWIDKAFRRKDYGTMLICHVEWIAKKLSKYKTMEALTIKDSEEAKGLFEANGYTLFPDGYGEFKGIKNL